MPPVFEMKVHRVNDHSWFIPYFLTESKNNFEIPKNWIYIEKI